jgi:hypothetical protein
MKIGFKHLFTVSIEHDYYVSRCRDFSFVNVGGTGEMAMRGRLVVREMEGVLHVLYEVDEEGKAIASLADEHLFIGLRPLNPYFENFTVPVIGNTGGMPLFANSESPTAFAAAGSVLCISGSFAPEPQDPARPVALSLRNAKGDVLASKGHSEAGMAPAFDVRGLPSGRYSLLEDYGKGKTKTRELFVDGDSAIRGLWGILAIRIDPGFYDRAEKAPPPNIPLHFQARSEQLKYYVVAPGFDKSAIDIVDGGLNGPGDTALAFTRNEDDIPESLLNAGPSPGILFSTVSPIHRRERGLRNLHLKRAAEILIEHLPQPSADRPQAQFIIHLSKP